MAVTKTMDIKSPYQTNYWENDQRFLGYTDRLGADLYPKGQGHCILCGDTQEFKSMDDASHWIENHLSICLSKGND